MISNGKLVWLYFLKIIGNIFYLIINLILLLSITGLFGYSVVNLTLGEISLFYRYLIIGVVLILVLLIFMFTMERIKFKSLVEHVARKEGVLNSNAINYDKYKLNSVLKAILILLSIIIIFIIVILVWLYFIAMIMNNGNINELISQLFNL